MSETLAAALIGVAGNFGAILLGWLLARRALGSLTIKVPFNMSRAEAGEAIQRASKEKVQAEYGKYPAPTAELIARWNAAGLEQRAEREGQVLS